VSRAGYVLTGGRSSRMGHDKALLPFRGGTLAAFVAREVRQAAGSATLVGDPESYDSLGLPVIPDLYPGEGPLGGILTALAHTAADYNLVTACDLPAISAAFLGLLLDAAETSGANAFIPTHPVSGLPEPLCAVYHRRALPAIEAAFGRGVRKVMAAFEDPGGGLHAVRFETSEVASFQNVNTPEEWACIDL